MTMPDHFPITSPTVCLLLPPTAASEQVDRPGFDLGGSSGKTTAGFGLGLGNNSSDTKLERSLPGRRFRGKLSIPRWRGPDVAPEARPSE
jgi:hypothetical protein